MQIEILEEDLLDDKCLYKDHKKIRLTELYSTLGGYQQQLNGLNSQFGTKVGKALASRGTMAGLCLKVFK